MASNYPPDGLTIANAQMEAELALGELEDILAEGSEPESGYARSGAWWVRKADVVRRCIDVVVAAEQALTEAGG